jgi:hypothetical protein
MSILDVLIYIADFLFQHVVLALLPSGNGAFSPADLQIQLDSFKGLVIQSFSGLGFCVPMALILLFTVIILSAEFSLFGYSIIVKALKWAHIIG